MILHGLKDRLFKTEGKLSAAATMMLLAPIALLYIFVFALPVLQTFLSSFGSADGPLHYYRTVAKEPLYTSVLFRTLQISFLVTAISILIGYPLALVLANSTRRLVTLGFAIVILTMWLSILVRSYSWVVLLGRDGVVSKIARALGLLGENDAIIFSETAVVIAMVHVLLPFMIFPIYASLIVIPKNLGDAAKNLGATPRETFLTVTLPLSKPGVFSGSVLVFVVALGFFVTPQLVGGPSSLMAATLISRELSYGTDWGLASAISVVLLVIALAIVAVFGRFLKFDGP